MMKTLNEVIEAIEVCRDSYVAGKIIKSDALHYLKEYKEAGINLIKLRENIESYAMARVNFEEAYNVCLKIQEENDRNDPLSWEELQGMEGKPVWIELFKDGAVFKAGWYLIIMIDDSLPDIPDLGLVNANGEYSRLEIEWMNMGQWKAYRKERK